MPQRHELSAAVQTVEEFAASRPELGTYRVGLRRNRVIRPSRVSILGHSRNSGRRDKYLSPAAVPEPLFGPASDRFSIQSRPARLPDIDDRS